MYTFKHECPHFIDSRVTAIKPESAMAKNLWSRGIPGLKTEKTNRDMDFASHFVQVQG